MTLLKRKTHKPQAVETITEPEQGFAQVAFADIDIAIDSKLTAAEWRLWLYLEKVKPSKHTSKELAKRLGTSPCTIEKAIDRLAELGLCEPPNRIQHTYIEKAVRDRLHAQLGGLVEVATPAGRIDLLTNSEITEVKAIKDWKAALGQILVYSSFYPQHQKRLHLFGTARELEALVNIEAAIISFGIRVTGEEVV
ncbi:MarR family transcriptional regulator [Aliterella atlantica]|uniref:MarR family transcriptional regulator n=1 Tax=Aliterella atlantica TaxID=1827278 RepID=UPI0006982661|nr:MarR family transcriptional regulator [Aliterella atlantica]